MTGVVTDVFVTEGQAVLPGDPLFVMRLTHEDVVQAQTEYLKTLEAPDVEDREPARLRNVTRGVAAGKVVLERRYEKQKLEGLLKAQRQNLLLHGLGEGQVARIAAERNLVPATALPADSLGPRRGGVAGPVRGLQIAFAANRVDPVTRAVPFYVLLPNEVVSDTRVAPDGGRPGRFLTWRYKPGQRFRLRAPVELYEGVIVLPVAAVAEAGAERFAFVENGSAFERRPVRVESRDADSVVIADDGSLLPGETVAVTAARQLQMALQNAAGGGADPHAGHNH